MTPGLLAFILVSKFCDAILFYRQEKHAAVRTTWRLLRTIWTRASSITSSPKDFVPFVPAKMSSFIIRVFG